MKKIIFLFLLLLLLTSCHKTTTNTFEDFIKDYPYNPNKIAEYEKEYQETSNIIYAINKVNYPDFLTPKTSNFLAFSKNNIFFVNTNYHLNNNYIPKSLVNVNNVDYIVRENQTMQVDKETLIAYQELFEASLNENLNLTIFSAYRSYEYQVSLYNKEDNSFVAAPGTSEHQTGTALDIATKTTGLTSHFEQTKECKWLETNAYKYGFIQRYQKDKEKITGYPYESWHYRFVGKDIAKIIYEQNITLEEYFYQNIIL